MHGQLLYIQTQGNHSIVRGNFLGLKLITADAYSVFNASDYMMS